MSINLVARESLVVAADYSPKEYRGIAGVKSEVIELAKVLSGLNVYIKVNSILRAVGYGLIHDLHKLGLKVFADLKLIDIPNTMATDGEFLSQVKPDILTVMSCAGIDGMKAVQETVGENTEVLGVTVLTSLNEEECQAIFSCSSKTGVLRFARMAQLAGLGGLILSPQEVDIVKNRKELVLSLNTPGMRPDWFLTKGDDQTRVMTPYKAIKAGAKRIVVGRPITQALNPREAVVKTLEEIELALKEK